MEWRPSWIHVNYVSFNGFDFSRLSIDDSELIGEKKIKTYAIFCGSKVDSWRLEFNTLIYWNALSKVFYILDMTI